MASVVVDEEFKSAIPPLSVPELEMLEASIVKEGCRDSLVLWGNVLIDGHNRHEICTRLGINYNTVVREFADRDGALDWIDDNQLGRRNLSPDQMSFIRGRRYNRTKKDAHSRPGNSNASNATDKMSTANPNTATTLAAQYGVTERTIRRDGVAAAAIDTLPVIAAAVVSGEISKTDALQVAQMPIESQEEIISAVSQGEAIKDAIKPHVSNNSGNNEWYTPSAYIEVARRTMGSIDLDPASSPFANKTVKASKFYTSGNNGIEQEWAGNVWMNPPYSQPIMSLFCDTLVTKFENGEVKSACVLVNNATETLWFQRLLDGASAVCMVKSRIKFIDPTGKPSGTPLQGQCMLYFGEDVESFKRECVSIGKVLWA